MSPGAGMGCLDPENIGIGSAKGALWPTRPGRLPTLAGLPIYGCDFNDGDVRKGIIDSGATSIYVNDKLVKKLSLPVTKIATRKVRIADKEVVVVHGYTAIDVKTGDLPVESVMAYLFPLDNIDLVLGLPWLQKHNP